MTKPELLTRWFGPRGWSLVVCEVDFKVGGIWRFVLRGPDDTDMGMRGVYREIAPPERLVHTHLFDDVPAGCWISSRGYVSRSRLRVLQASDAR